MRIMIGDKYVITSDPLNIIVSKRNVVKKGKNAGKEALDTIGFFSTLKDAVVSVFDREARLVEAKSLKELADRIEKIKADILAAVPAMETEFLKEYKQSHPVRKKRGGK